MTFVFGRKKLVISLTSEQPETVADLYPMAQAANDKELARLSKIGSGATDRIAQDVNRVMYGAGYLR